MDLFEQETNLKCDIKPQGHRQCSTLEGQTEYYGDIIQKSKGVKKNLVFTYKECMDRFNPPPHQKSTIHQNSG